MTEQMNIFECLYPAYKITKPIRLIELFAGYGSQALALKYLGVPFEHWKICEWNYKSFQAYKDIHMPNDSTDYSAGLTKDKLVDTLSAKGISSDWNKSMKYEQVKRLGESKLREIYNNIIATHNLVDVSSAHAEDLQIVEQDKYTYLLTYSFPCQDLSLAGLRQSMDRDSGTRSSLLWEVERILQECKEDNCLPDVLLMENVPQVHGTENARNWREWLTELERLGYQSYWEDMIATDYGMPQIRNRTFCISLLGEHSYNFPAPIKLNKRLKDLLESKVADKFYLSSRALNGILHTTFSQTTLDARTENDDGCIPTLAARDYKDPKLVIEDVEHYEIKPAHGYFPGSVKKANSISTIDACINYQHIVLGEKRLSNENKPRLLCNIYGEQFGTGFAGNVWDSEKTCPALMTMAGGNRQPLIVAEDKGAYVQLSGEGVYEKENRFYKFDAISPTVNTCAGGNRQPKVIEPPTVIGGVGEKKSNGGTQYYLQDRIYKGDVSTTTTTTSEAFQPYNAVEEGGQLRIRKLTPRECFRLMGVKDAEFERVQRHQSDSTLYHLAGDSIVTTCLMAIFGELLGVEWKEKVDKLHG